MVLAQRRFTCPECEVSVRELCDECALCRACCDCPGDDRFDADELGIDPELDAERFDNA